jgi:hypothetical protein
VAGPAGGALDALETDAATARRSPVETTNVQLPTGDRLQIPTGAETLRLQSYLVLCRNNASDYVQLAELVEANGLHNAAAVLAGIDRYYTSGQTSAQPGRQWIATQLVRRLADPMPSEGENQPGWDDVKWENIRQTCLNLAVAILEEAS